MIIISRILLTIFFMAIAPIVQSFNFVLVTENQYMKVFVDTDSIASKGGYITANEIRDYKSPMDFDKEKTYLSSLGLAEINCKANTSRIAFIDAFELNGLKGDRIAHGVRTPPCNSNSP
jgi:hypothetical protein